MYVLAKALAVLRMGHEVALEQPQRFILVTERHAGRGPIAKQLALGVDHRISFRAGEHVTSAICEPCPTEDERDPNLLIQPGQRSVTLGRELHDLVRESPREGNVRIGGL